ncbi:MAG TPA: hypothetical protein DCP03_08625, partial [Polaromonas sp.]|nr:hypothetical protein [Polaromonas sp.]
EYNRPNVYLFVPAMRAERIAKAFDAGAHAVIVDLEDTMDARQNLRVAPTKRPFDGIMKVGTYLKGVTDVLIWKCCT